MTHIKNDLIEMLLPLAALVAVLAIGSARLGVFCSRARLCPVVMFLSRGPGGGVGGLAMK